MAKYNVEQISPRRWRVVVNSSKTPALTTSSEMDAFEVCGLLNEWDKLEEELDEIEDEYNINSSSIKMRISDIKQTLQEKANFSPRQVVQDG